MNSLKKTHNVMYTHVHVCVFTHNQKCLGSNHFFYLWFSVNAMHDGMRCLARDLWLDTAFSDALWDSLGIRMRWVVVNTSSVSRLQHKNPSGKNAPRLFKPPACLSGCSLFPCFSTRPGVEFSHPQACDEITDEWMAVLGRGRGCL